MFDVTTLRNPGKNLFDKNSSRNLKQNHSNFHGEKNGSIVSSSEQSILIFRVVYVLLFYCKSFSNRNASTHTQPVRTGPATATAKRIPGCSRTVPLPVAHVPRTEEVITVIGRLQ